MMNQSFNGIPVFPGSEQYSIPPMFAEAAAPIAPAGVSNSSTGALSIIDIARELFDGNTGLARRLVAHFALPQDKNGGMDPDDFYTALGTIGIPKDIEDDYANAPETIKRVADEFFNGQTVKAEQFVKAAGIKPDANGRYSLDELTSAFADSDFVFTESAQQHARKLTRRRAQLMAESTPDGKAARHREVMRINAARKAAMAFEELQEAEKAERKRHDAAMLESARAHLRPAQREAVALMEASLGIQRRYDDPTPLPNSIRCYSLFTESAPDADKISFDDAQQQYFNGNRAAAMSLLNLFDMKYKADSKGRFLRSEIAFIAKHEQF